jgi:hypothetical protein
MARNPQGSGLNIDPKPDALGMFFELDAERGFLDGYFGVKAKI